ncbi:class I SAM-dependent methyltransferase [Polymorphobacter fuscus]|uniref:Class I SAM-dependent methyltransferase n=1 Tax=Sandarakinorhabdus fusca TaxID=1439888 RepID=A0A7C9GQR1_9SPHN|nr:class I SAM-dependent methyltransferase [Polymorphobacter fuscus]KAB7643859.1 class I SAM-dependent methyltransferase [Polymorphobacter fuscus]MQT18555.1 class I SAM-dependent methyltransferase [Polymorphobacter fuscus]NJC07078.1 SAM-dependent methyltransferase [Polymorphobacter fuscus]
MRDSIRANPAVPRMVWEAVYPLFHQDRRWSGSEYSDRKSAFSTIYRDNRWGSRESVSGRGSTLDNTGSVRTELPKLLEALDVETFLDAPCGDFNWARHLRLPERTRYIGGDIVEALVADLQDKYSDARHRFINIDIVDGPLPQADLWLCRHVLFHLSNADIRATLRNFAASSIEWLVTESLFTGTTNADITSGGFRLINLLAPPFGLPKPVDSFADYYPPNAPVHLCRWSRAQVADAARRWPAD